MYGPHFTSKGKKNMLELKSRQVPHFCPWKKPPKLSGRKLISTLHLEAATDSDLRTCFTDEETKVRSGP